MADANVVPTPESSATVAAAPACPRLTMWKFFLRYFSISVGFVLFALIALVAFAAIEGDTSGLFEVIPVLFLVGAGACLAYALVVTGIRALLFPPK